jgi:hypothetical protein
MSIDLPTPAEPAKPTASISISKDQAMNLKVGLAVRLEVVGEVKAVSKCYNDDEKYEVCLEDPIVKNITEDDTKDETESEDDKKNLAMIPKEELKKLISKEY